MYLNEAILSSFHNICFRAEVKEIMHAPVKSKFCYIKGVFKTF